jgi:hypothetical protein
VASAMAPAFSAEDRLRTAGGNIAGGLNAYNGCVLEIAVPSFFFVSLCSVYHDVN